MDWTVSSSRSGRPREGMMSEVGGSAWAVNASAGIRVLSTMRQLAAALSHPDVFRLRWLHGTNGDNERKIRVVGFQLGWGQFLLSHPSQKGYRAQNAAIGGNRDLVRSENFTKQRRTGGGCETPVVRRQTVAWRQPAHRRHCRQKHAPWTQNTKSMGNRGAGVIDELKRLSQKEAVKQVRWHCLSRGQVGDVGGLRVRRINIEHLPLLHASAKTMGVSAVSDFQNAPANILAVLLQKLLNVVPIHWRTPIKPP